MNDQCLDAQQWAGWNSTHVMGSNEDNSLIDGNPHNKSRAAYKIDKGPT